MRKLKVLLVTDSLSNGGAERQLTLLARNLPPSIDRRVWSMDDGVFVSDLKRSGITVETHIRRFKKDISPMYSLWKTIFTWKPDLVHSYGYMSTLAALPICKLKRIPIIDGTIRLGKLPIKGRKLWLLSMRAADLIIANSQAGLAAFQVDPHKGRVVYNGFDFLRLSNSLAENLPISRRFTVIMAARMNQEKNFDGFIQVARILGQSEPDTWQFIALGNGPDRTRLLQENKDLVENGIICFPEPTTEIIPYINNAQVGVLLTNSDYHAEGISNSILEYMASGKPVICNENGGNRELVIDGVTGFVVRDKNLQELADKLRRLKNNPKEREAFGARGKERVHAIFSIENLVKQTLSVYDEALAGKESYQLIKQQ